MDEPVVEGAEQHQVPKIGRPSVAPVLDVVRMQMSTRIAPWEAAGPIPQVKRSTQGGTQTPIAAAEIHGCPVAIDHAEHDPGLAGQASEDPPIHPSDPPMRIVDRHVLVSLCLQGVHGRVEHQRVTVET